MTAPQTDMIVAEQNGMAKAAPVPQYMQGFEGAAVQPFDDKVRAILAERVRDEDVEIKPNGIVYVPGVWYRRQLTRAFGPGGWAMLPRGPSRVMGNIIVYPGVLVCLGRYVAEAVGECAYHANNPTMSYASAYEGAKTDAVTRCCKDLGMATELWDPAWREQWTKKNAHKRPDGKWERNDANRRQSSPINLMSGAGGAAPPTPSTAGASAVSATGAPSSSSGSPDPKGDGASATTGAPWTSATRNSGSSRAADSASSDTGEAATEEQKTAITGRIRALKWKIGYVRIWFWERFGDDFKNATNPIEALTSAQADTAYLLLNAFGNESLYAQLISGFKADGKVFG